MRDDKDNNNITGKVAGATVAEPKRHLTKPSMYKVKLLNDDYTPIDFVIYVMQKFFHKSHDEALATSLQVHNAGYAVCGFYTKDVAETKVGIVNDYARKSQHPLKCTLEENS